MAFDGAAQEGVMMRQSRLHHGGMVVPAVRAAGKDTLVIANGFSCREQILHNTDHKPMHLAQVIKMGLQQTGGGRMAQAE